MNFLTLDKTSTHQKNVRLVVKIIIGGGVLADAIMMDPLAPVVEYDQ